MADWYCSSAAYTAVAQFAISTAYTIGNIIRQLATPTPGNERCFRCTTAGTSAGSEPTWTLTKGSTTTSGTAVFTEVTGNSTYNWSAPAKTLNIFNSSNFWEANSDRVFVSSDHSETWAAVTSYNFPNDIQIISVNRAGSVPPVAADLLPGAAVATSGGNNLLFCGPGLLAYGLTLTAGSGANFANLTTANTNQLAHYKSCAFILGCSTNLNSIVATSGYNTIWENCTVQFGHVTNGISIGNGGFLWKDTPNAIAGATLPTSLFKSGSAAAPTFFLHGVDLSALGSGQTIWGDNSASASRLKMFGCKLNASVAIAVTSGGASGPQVELINCDSGATGYRNELYQYANTQTTETTITRSGGASDGVQAVSWKVVTTTGVVAPIGAFLLPLFVWNATLSSVTATVEIISSTTLTNADIWMEIEYLGSAATPQLSIASSAPALLTAASNVASSSTTWNSSPATPVKQKLQVTFTPAMAGLVKAVIKVAKTSTTLYVDPLLAVA